jgi:hypothetical protein
MTDNIHILKLATGEEILAEIVSSVVGGDIIIKNPVRIVVMPNKLDPKTPNIGFAPWMEFSVQKNITIDSRHIIAKAEPIKEFIEQYNMMFSNIVVPQSKLILPS